MSTTVHSKKMEPMRPGDVYIGRGGHNHGRFGNPVVKGKTCPVCGDVHVNNGDTIGCYRIHLWNRLKAEPSFAKDVKSLHGKRLFCWCAKGVGGDLGGAKCHGEVLARAAKWLASGGVPR